MPEPVRSTQPAPAPGSVPASVPAPTPAAVPSPVAMTASPPSAAAEPVPRRSAEPAAAEDWARYAVPGGHQPPAVPGGHQPPAAPGGHQLPAVPGGHQPPADPARARLAAAAPAPAAVGVFTGSGSPQHTVTAPANGDPAGAAVPPEDTDSSNRNSMGFQITSIRQSSAEPDADPIDESGDEDVSDTAESSRTAADGAGLTSAPGESGVSAVDGLPGRLQLPLASTPSPSAALTPRELTASPGVTGAEVLPVIPTIDGFGIALVPGALESVDARGSAEIVEFPSEIEMDLMPTGLTVGVAPGSPGDDLQETWQSRFKVVKIETNVPFKRGRWQCMDFMDQPEAAGAGADGPGSAGSSAHSSVQLTAGEPEPPPQPVASEEASLPGLAEDPGVRREAPRIEPAAPEPAAVAAATAAAATTTGAPAAQPSLSVPHQPAAQAAAAGGLPPGRDAAAAASAPNVTADRGGVSLTVGAAAATGLARQSSQPATPEEARLAGDGVPVFRPAEPAPRPPAAGGLTLPDLLPNSSFLDLVQASVGDEQEGAAGRWVRRDGAGRSSCMVLYFGLRTCISTWCFTMNADFKTAMNIVNVIPNH